MFKNRKTALLAKKTSELATIRESSDGQQPESAEKIRRVESAGQMQTEQEDPFGSEEFIVPASQPTQTRYSSQRSNLQKSQSARTSRRIPANYFENVLLKCQVDLDDPTSIVLKCEPIAFVRTVREMLRTAPDFPRNVKDFINGVEQASRCGETFRKLLECCQLQNRNTGDLKTTQESLMKMLLCVEFMQLELITLLFEYVERTASEGGVVITGLVLSQIKFIDHTVHGEVVFDKYFEVLERCHSGQLVREAIASLQDVIDVSKQDEAFQKILELLPQAAELFTPTNLSVFCEMCLSGATLRATRQKVVGFVENGCPLEVYPALVKFLLKFNGSEVDSLYENISEIRQVVDRLARLGDESNKQMEDIFQSIYQALTVSGVLYDAWIRYCRLLTDEDSHMAVDLLILLMLLTVNHLKSGVIQKILANKLKKRHLVITHMEELTTRYGVVLKKHMDCVLDFVESCLKEKQIEVCEFGVMSMSYLFSANSMDNKLVLNKLVGFLCEMVLVNEAARNDHLIAVCMNTLTNIHEKYPNDIRNCAHILLKMMDVKTDLSLEQYRMAVSIICEAIQIPDQPIHENEAWDSINIIIKKQLLSNHKEVKKKGVVGVARMIHHLLKNSAVNPEELSSSFDSDKTIGSATDIPTAAGREIGNMFNLMIVSSSESNDILGLCYDELANTLQDFKDRIGKPERAFTIWLCETITNDFQQHFVTDEELPSGNAVQFAKKLCINESNDVENTNAEAFTIAVNVASSVLAHNSRYSAICFFLPLFKLLKSVQAIRSDGQLDAINALLGCSIVVPSFYDEPDEKTLVETFEEDVCRQILDAYFYVANWFRELINAFTQQPDPSTHRKVLQRLSALVHLEQRLAGLLRTVDFDYVPPICNFLTKVPAKTVRPGREPSSKPNVSQNATKTQLDQTTRNRADEKDFDGESVSSRYRFGFRTLDGHTIELFRETLMLCHKLPDNKVGHMLGLAEYRFLLETVTSVIEAKVGSRVKQNFPYKLEAILEVLPNVVDKFVKIKAKRRELNGSTEQSDLPDFKALSCCFNWSLRCFTGILQLVKPHPEHLETVLNILYKLTSSTEAEETNDVLVEHIISSELNHKHACKDLFSASCLYSFGLALKSSAPSESSATTIATFCQKFICTNFHKKTGTTNHLTQLLQGTFAATDFSKIKRLTKALEEDLSASKTDVRHLAGIQRPHYPLLFKELSKAFIGYLQAELRSRKTIIQRFVLWEQSCEIVKQFSEVSRHAENVKIYACYMRYTHTYLKLFQQAGIKTLEDVLKVTADRVYHLIRTLQYSTRYLHNICCHSKSVKDNSLTVQIPFIRETLETLLYNIKAVLAANNCPASVFEMGNLKNKDLKGDLLLSQREQESEDEEDGSEDIGDFLSNDEEDDDDDRRASVLERRESTAARSSQSKCF